MEQYSTNEAMERAEKIAKKANEIREQQGKTGEPSTDDYRNANDTINEKALEYTRNYITLSLGGSSLSSADHYARECNLPLCERIGNLNALIQAQKLYGAILLFMDSYENGEIAKEARDNIRARFKGEGGVGDIIGHDIGYAIYKWSKEEKIVKVCDIFKKLREGKDGEAYDWKASAEEAYAFFKDVKDKLEQLDLDVDVIAEYLSIFDDINLDREDGMKKLIQGALKSKIPKVYYFTKRDMERGEPVGRFMTEQVFNQIDTAFEKWEKEDYSSFQNFIDESREFDAILDEIPREYEADFGNEFTLQKTLYREDIVQLCAKRKI